jgi:hypothetical protein
VGFTLIRLTPESHFLRRNPDYYGESIYGWRRVRSGLPAQPTSLPVLGIFALGPENTGEPRHFEPETEAETPGGGAFGTAE